MTWDPLVPLWLTLVLSALAVAATLRAYRTLSGALVLRLGLITIIAIMLGNPVRDREQPVTRRPNLLLVADSSGSMATGDGPGGSARFAQARVVAAQVVSALDDLYQVSQVGFTDQLQAPLPDQPDGDTDFSGLTALVAQAPKPAAVIFISDGADWRLSDPDSELARARITVHTLGVGDQRPTTNVALGLEVASPTVFPGQELPMTVTVIASPDVRGQRVQLEVDTIGDNGEGVALARQEIVLDAMVRVPLVDTPSGNKGGRLWRARIAPLPGEQTADDNQDFASAQVVDRSVRVLVFEGQPWWDTTYAVRAWRRDKQLDVATAFGVGKRTWRAGNAAPDKLDAESLQGVDVVVLGQALDRLSGKEAAEVLSKFVDRGGGLVLLGPGRRLAGALDHLDPIAAGGALSAVELSSSDSGIPGLLPKDVRLPARTAGGGQLKPQARVLLGNRDQPLIASRHVGGGWVCSVNLEGVWNWNIAGQGREVGERFWRQILRTLTNAPVGSLRAERLRLGVGEEMVVWLQADEKSKQAVRLIHPDGRAEELTVFADTVRARLDKPGLYRVERGNEKITVVATLEVREKLEIARDDARLMRLAAATGGEFADAADHANLINRLRTARVMAGTVRRPEPLISDAMWFIAALVLAGLEWWLRRKRGMV